MPATDDARKSSAQRKILPRRRRSFADSTRRAEQRVLSVSRSISARRCDISRFHARLAEFHFRPPIAPALPKTFLLLRTRMLRSQGRHCRRPRCRRIITPRHAHIDGLNAQPAECQQARRICQRVKSAPKRASSSPKIKKRIPRPAAAAAVFLTV